MSTQTLTAPTPACTGDLRRFQRKVVRIVAQLVVQDNDGNHVCKMTASTELEKPFVMARALLLGFVDEWSKLYDGLLEIVQERRFGCLSDDAITKMDVLVVTGQAILSGLKQIHAHDGENTKTRTGDCILDLTIAMQSLLDLQDSYVDNPSDEELDSLAMIAG